MLPFKTEAKHFPLVLHLFGPARETSTASMESANKRYTKRPWNRYSSIQCWCNCPTSTWSAHSYKHNFTCLHNHINRTQKHFRDQPAAMLDHASLMDELENEVLLSFADCKPYYYDRLISFLIHPNSINFSQFRYNVCLNVCLFYKNARIFDGILLRLSCIQQIVMYAVLVSNALCWNYMQSLAVPN